MSTFPFSELDRGPIHLGSPPTEKELREVGRFGVAIGRTGRASLMNAIGTRLLIPPGGFTGQSRLFVKGDIRLEGVLALISHDAAAKSIAANLARAARNTDTNFFLTFVTAAREHASALTATGGKMVDSWREGGMDFLWKNKDQLGLPKAVTGGWAPVPKFRSPETHHIVEPAYIPARDQTVVYAAQISSSFQRHFKARLQHELGADASIALATSSRVARLVWQAYAFLAPGGRAFDPEQPLHAQTGQAFGSQTALGYIIHRARAKDAHALVNLDMIFQDPALNHATEWVRSAKTRVAETLFLERLLTTVRELRTVSSP
jgi:hypothetical protein